MLTDRKHNNEIVNILVTGQSLINVTSSSANADRPRVALCLSVVSFCSTVPRTPSFIIVNLLLRLQIYDNVQLNAALLSST